MTVRPGLGTPGGVVAAGDHRRSLSGLWTPSSASDQLAVRSGIVPGPGDPLKVSQASPLGMSVMVNPGVLEVYRTGAAKSLYAPTNDAVATLPLAAAPTANSRWDLVVMGQRDAEAGDANNNPILTVLTGVAQAIPTKPYDQLEAGAIALAEIGPITTSTTQITDAMITNVAPYTAVRGAPVRVRNQTERDALTSIASASNPITVERLDTGTLERNAGSGWFDLASQQARMRATRGSVQSIPNGVPTTIAFDTADTHGRSSMWSSGTPQAITVPLSGWYTCTANVGFEPNTSGYRVFWLTAGATRITEELMNPASGAPTQASLGTTVWLPAGTQVVLYTYQTSGGALNVITSEVLPTMSVVSA